jgi:hypothetical protein
MEHWAIEEFFWHGLPGDTWALSGKAGKLRLMQRLLPADN